MSRMPFIMKHRRKSAPAWGSSCEGQGRVKVVSCTEPTLELGSSQSFGTVAGRRARSEHSAGEGLTQLGKEKQRVTGRSRPIVRNGGGDADKSRLCVGKKSELKWAINRYQSWFLVSSQVMRFYSHVCLLQVLGRFPLGLWLSTYTSLR